MHDNVFLFAVDNTLLRRRYGPYLPAPKMGARQNSEPDARTEIPFFAIEGRASPVILHFSGGAIRAD
jgi:hypothetical protein